MEDPEDLPPRYSTLEPIDRSNEIWAQSGANVNGITDVCLLHAMR